MLTHSLLKMHYRKDTIIMPSLPLMHLRHRKAKQPTQGHTPIRGLSWDTNLDHSRCKTSRHRVSTQNDNSYHHCSSTKYLSKLKIYSWPLNNIGLNWASLHYTQTCSIVNTIVSQIWGWLKSLCRTTMGRNHRYRGAYGSYMWIFNRAEGCHP